MVDRQWIGIDARSAGIIGAALLVGGVAGFFVGRHSTPASAETRTDTTRIEIVGSPHADDAFTAAANSRFHETGRRVECASHMRQIGAALTVYADQHGGALPPTFAALRASGAELTADAFVCPSSVHGENFVYLPNAPASADAIVLYEPLSNHEGDGANFLRRNGTVSWESAADARKLIAAQRP